MTKAPAPGMADDLFDEVTRRFAAETTDISSFVSLIASLDLKGASVLEVGCGLGDKLIHCADRGAAHLAGFDPSRERIRLALEKTHNRPGFSLRQACAETYEPDRPFDLVVIWGVLEYVEAPYAVLDTYLRAVAPGGHLVLAASNPILLKRLAGVFRRLLSGMALSRRMALAAFLGRVLRVFGGLWRRVLTVGSSSTYSLEQSIAEGLMVPRYNLFDIPRLRGQMAENGFRLAVDNDLSASMHCLVARRWRVTR